MVHSALLKQLPTSPKNSPTAWAMSKRLSQQDSPIMSSKPVRIEPGVKLRDADKMALIPVKIVPTERDQMLRKPEWLKVKLPASTQRIDEIKQAMRKHGLHSVCEEASCPNLAECFNHGTATFMILGAICTRRCPFCDVAHGRPLPVDPDEAHRLAATIRDMKGKYVVKREGARAGPGRRRCADTGPGRDRAHPPSHHHLHLSQRPPAPSGSVRSRLNHRR